MSDDITYCQLTERNRARNQHVFAYSSDFGMQVPVKVLALTEKADMLKRRGTRKVKFALDSEGLVVSAVWTNCLGLGEIDGWSVAVSTS